MSWSANEPLTSPRSALTQGPLRNLTKKLNLQQEPRTSRFPTQVAARGEKPSATS